MNQLGQQDRLVRRSQASAGDGREVQSLAPRCLAAMVIPLLVVAGCLLLSGCAAITNPVANGIPARLLPPELLAKSRENLEETPLHWLQRPKELPYRLAAGDTLAVFIDGVLGEVEQVPPVHFPEVTEIPPSIGYPIPVGEDGTVALPFVDPIEVQGLTVDEARERIIQTYTSADVGKEIVRKGESRVLVELLRPRQTQVLVFRQDAPGQRSLFQGFGFTTLGLYGRQQRIAAQRETTALSTVVQLPATEAHLLGALGRTGGLPPLRLADEVFIYRGFQQATAETPRPVKNGGSASEQRPERRVIHIPLRLPPGSPPPFRPEDIVLEEGDIVYVPVKDTEFYYTGGLLPAFEVPLPIDYDLTVVEAVLRAGGPMINGGFNANNLSGTLVAGRIGNPSPSLLTVLRRTPDGAQVAIRVDLNRALRDARENLLVQNGDVLLLQETPSEAVTRYLTQTFDLSIFAELFRRGSAVGTTSFSGP